MKLDDLIGKITCADCLDILKQLPDKCVDLVLTDPPYGIGISNDSVRHRHPKKDWDNNIPNKKVFDEMLRISTNQIICGGNYFALPPTRCFIVWDKQISPDFSLAMAEYFWTSFDRLAKIYRMPSEKGERIHPTQKPLKLFETILSDYSKENDLVLDCFSGSGTTEVACHNLKRRFICIEKDPQYWKASCERLEQAQRQQTLF